MLLNACLKYRKPTSSDPKRHGAVTGRGVAFISFLSSAFCHQTATNFLAFSASPSVIFFASCISAMYCGVLAGQTGGRARELVGETRSRDTTSRPQSRSELPLAEHAKIHADALRQAPFRTNKDTNLIAQLTDIMKPIVHLLFDASHHLLAR
jgi:hypothetical protein